MKLVIANADSLSSPPLQSYVHQYQNEKGYLCMQEEQMRHLYSKHKRQRGYLQLIADDMPGAFKKSQIKTHLRKLGLKLQVNTRDQLAR